MFLASAKTTATKTNSGEIGGEPSSDNNAVLDEGGNKYCILKQLGINLDLSIDQNKSFINALVGECFALQREYNPGQKATNEYRRPTQYEEHSQDIFW